MVFFKIFQRQNLIKIYTKKHQFAPFPHKISGEQMPSNPSSKAHGFARRSMLLCDMQISKHEKSWLRL